MLNNYYKELQIISAASAQEQRNLLLNQWKEEKFIQLMDEQEAQRQQLDNILLQQVKLNLVINWDFVE